jgi:DNA-directed RNA polymerase specialized sigma24 family protein
VLHVYVGQTVPEVAAALGIPVGTAKSRLHRSLRELRVLLEPIEADDASLAPEGQLA